MKKQEIELFTYDEIFSIFKKMDELKASIKKAENELHWKMLKEMDSNIFHPYSLKVILENDEFDKYRAEARKELLHVAIELKELLKIK